MNTALVIAYPNGNENCIGYIRCIGEKVEVSQNGIRWWEVTVESDAPNNFSLIQLHGSKEPHGFVWKDGFHYFYQGRYERVVHGEDTLKLIFGMGTH